MDTTDFDAVYSDLLRVAESIRDTANHPVPARDDIDWTLSHIALSDSLLAEAARDIHHGRDAVVNNRGAMNETAITELIASTTHQQRVAMVSDHARELRDALDAIPDRAAERPVLLRLFDRAGDALPEQHTAWQDLITLRITTHIPGHTARIRTYAATDDTRRDA